MSNNDLSYQEGIWEKYGFIILPTLIGVGIGGVIVTTLYFTVWAKGSEDKTSGCSDMTKRIITANCNDTTVCDTPQGVVPIQCSLGSSRGLAIKNANVVLTEFLPILNELLRVDNNYFCISNTSVCASPQCTKNLGIGLCLPTPESISCYVNGDAYRAKIPTTYNLLTSNNGMDIVVDINNELCCSTSTLNLTCLHDSNCLGEVMISNVCNFGWC